MPRVTYVKKARKDNPICKAGESYYWWKFNFGPKGYSLTPPKASQLTRSEFLSQMYSFEEQIGALVVNTADDLRDAVENIAEEIRALGEEQTDKLCNMPEGLQEGPTGELLQIRYDECEAMADELERIDFDDYSGPDWGPEKDGKLQNDPPEVFLEWLGEKLEEVQNVAYNGE